MAIERGYRHSGWLQQDTDLVSLHDDKRWLDIVLACNTAEENYLQTINRELYILYQQDQADRRGGDDIDWSQISERDQKRRIMVEQMLEKGEVKMADDYFHAAMIFQHGSDGESYQLAHELALKAVELDSTKSVAKWLACAAKDRFLWHIGEPQWYGTQFIQIDGLWTIDPIDTTMITDEERLEWNVPTLFEARQRVRQMNSDGE
jgi:hypothetical protein